MASRPESSPWEPAFGWSETASYPVISHSQPLSCSTMPRMPSVWSCGANGCRCANSGHVTATISVVALSFIVQEPSGIIPRSSAKSRSASRRR